MAQHSLSIGTRLRMSSGLVLAFLVIVAVIGWRNTVRFAAEIESLNQNNLKASVALATAERGLYELRFGLPNYLVGDAAGRAKIKADTPQWVQVVEDSVKAYSAKSLTDEERDGIKEFDTNWAAYLKARPVFFTLLDDGKTDEAKAFRAEHTNPPAARAVAAMAKLNKLQATLADRNFADISATARASRVLILVVGLAGGAVAAGVGYFTTRSITEPMRELAERMQEVAHGDADMTQRLVVRRQDELGVVAGSFNTFMDHLHGVLCEARRATDMVAAASGQLSSTASGLAGSAQAQASSLEETAASLEEITGSVKQNADNARQANQLATGSREVAQRGGQVVAEAVRSMGEINQSSKRIAQIISTIDEIAFQTNLLALNAAVEAARAGDQGRGFAVVASEVRNLAQRSATAAKEIKALIEDSVAKVELGSALVDKSGQTLNDIVDSVKRVTDIIAEIAAASAEQSSGIEQLNRAVAQMDQTVQGNTGQTEELSATATALSAQASQLHDIIGRFKLDRGVIETRPSAVAFHAPDRDAQGVDHPIAESAPPRRPNTIAPSLLAAAGVGAHGRNGTTHLEERSTR